MNRTPLSQALGLRPLRLSFFLLAALLLLFPALNARAQDNAAFVSQNVPASMVAGQQYSVSMTMQNTGTTTWTDSSSYHLGSINPRDNKTWNPPGNRVIQPLNVPPQGKVTFAFLVTAPAAVGSANFDWQMVHDGVAWFGPTSPNVVVTVTAPAGQPKNPQVWPGSSATLSPTGTSTASVGGLKCWEIDNAAGTAIATTSSPAG